MNHTIVLWVRDRGEQACDGRELEPGAKGYLIGRPAKVPVDVALHSPVISNRHAELTFSQGWHLRVLGQNPTWLDRDGHKELLKRGQSIEVLEGDLIIFCTKDFTIRFSYNTDGTMQQLVVDDDEPTLNENEADVAPINNSSVEGIDTLYEAAVWTLQWLGNLPLLKLIAIALIACAIAFSFHLFQNSDKPGVNESDAILMPKPQLNPRQQRAMSALKFL